MGFLDILSQVDFLSIYLVNNVLKKHVNIIFDEIFVMVEFD